MTTTPPTKPTKPITLRQLAAWYAVITGAFMLVTILGVTLMAGVDMFVQAAVILPVNMLIVAPIVTIAMHRWVPHPLWAPIADREKGAS